MTRDKQRSVEFEVERVLKRWMECFMQVVKMLMVEVVVMVVVVR